MNSSGSAVNKTFNLSGFSSSSSTASVVRTSASESFASVAAAPIANKRLTVSLPAGSVTTYSLDVGAPVASPWNATTEYEIKSVNGGQSLSIAGGSVSNGGQAVQTPDVDASEQRWRLQPDGGVFKLVNVKSGQALSVWGESTSDGANIVQWADGGGTHQRWRIIPDADGTFALVAAHSGKLLSVKDGSVAAGATLVQLGDTSATSQRWLIAPK
ncbi:hypothetical protein BH11ACT5_BH11ACT5_25320 [soil metagenome]